MGPGSRDNSVWGEGRGQNQEMTCWVPLLLPRVPEGTLGAASVSLVRVGPWTQPSWPRCEDVPICRSLSSQQLPPKGGAREIGDLNNGRKLLCLRVSRSPALLPMGVITGDGLRFSCSEPRPATTMLTLFPVLGYCYPMTVPRNTVTEHGINTHG